MANLLKNPQFIFKLPKSGSHEVHIIGHPHLFTFLIIISVAPLRSEMFANSKVNIALMQSGRRQLRDELGVDTFLPIGLTLFQLDKKIRKPMRGSRVPGQLVGGMAYNYDRTVTLQTKLPKGTYALVVSTYYPGMEGEFYLRVNSPDSVNLSVRRL